MPLVVIVILTSPVRWVSGPLASGVAGAIYKNLADQNYFVSMNSGQKTEISEILSYCSHWQ
jgi:hypothetical protein